MSPRIGDAIEPLRDRRFHGEFARPASDGSSLGDGSSDQGDDEGLACCDESRGRSGFGDDDRRREGTPDAGTGLSPGVGVADAAGEGGSGTDPGGRKLEGVRRWRTPPLPLAEERMCGDAVADGVRSRSCGVSDDDDALRPGAAPSSSRTRLLLVEPASLRPELPLRARLSAGLRSRLP
jgi:hypothetical protein